MTTGVIGHTSGQVSISIHPGKLWVTHEGQQIAPLVLLVISIPFHDPDNWPAVAHPLGQYNPGESIFNSL
jgi:hypothetical protein